MNKLVQSDVSSNRFNVAKPTIGAILAMVLVALLTTQFVQAKTDDSPDGEASADPKMCSTASLTSKPTPRQLRCLMEVQAEYGTSDCQVSNGFDVHLKSDVSQCEAKMSACLNNDDLNNNHPLKLEAKAPNKPKALFIIKREPAKLLELGRAQNPSETESYFVQCNNAEKKVKH